MEVPGREAAAPGPARAKGREVRRGAEARAQEAAVPEISGRPASGAVEARAAALQVQAVAAVAAAVELGLWAAEAGAARLWEAG